MKGMEIFMIKRIMNKIMSFVLIITMSCTTVGTFEVGAATPSKEGKISVTTKQLKSGELDYSSSKVEKVIKIKKAYEALAMFNGLGGPKCNYNKQIEKKGMIYYKVTSKKMNTMKKVKKYLKKYFSNSYVKKLLKMKLFVSKKGYVYFLVADRGANIMYQGTTYQIVKRTSSYREIKATSYYWHEDMPESNETKIDIYKQRKVHGRWVFTSITLPY